MADPVISRSVVSKVSTTTGGLEGTTPGRKGPPFEQVRQQLADRPPDKMAMPPAAPQPTAEIKKAQTAELHNKLKGATTPDQVFGPDMSKLEGELGKLRKGVEKIPKSSEFQPLWNRMEGLEQQFASADKKAKSLGSLDNPRQMLQLQLEVYQLTQNFEIVSKVVEQVNSGVKQIVQTQL
jgi:hypothetical protein